MSVQSEWKMQWENVHDFDLSSTQASHFNEDHAW